MSKTPEGQLLRLCMDWLAANHVMAFRMNTLAMPTADGKRFVKAGVPGMADILAFPRITLKDLTIAGAGQFYRVPTVYWLELKAPKGKQSDMQKSFQAKVESEGHRYAIIRSLEDLEEVLKG